MWNVLPVAGLVKTAVDADAWEFFVGSTLSIEILKDDVLQKIHFQVKDKVRHCASSSPGAEVFSEAWRYGVTTTHFLLHGVTVKRLS